MYLDEPTIGLDIVAQHALREFIADFNKNNATTIILTSHYMDDIKALCKRVLLIDQGKLIYDGELSGLTDSFSASKILRITFEENVEYNQLMIHIFLQIFRLEISQLKIFQLTKLLG